MKRSWRHLEDFSNTSWRCLEDTLARRDILKIFSRCLEDVLARRLEYVLKTPSRCLENGFKTFTPDVLKMSAKQLPDVLKTWLRQTYSSWSSRFEDIFTKVSVSWKTSNSLVVIYRATYNQFHNILRLSDILLSFPLTTSETMGDYYL